ncbi:4117_t:CDS:1, partial [Scutellospora calospora]
MSNKEISKKEQTKKIYCSSDEIPQITNNFGQLNSQDNNSRDFRNKIIKELCYLYNEERSKGENCESILNKLDQLLEKKKLNPNSIIDWCLEDQ